MSLLFFLPSPPLLSPHPPPHIPPLREPTHTHTDPLADRLRWYCKAPGAHTTPTVIREEAFHCTDLGTQLKPIIQRWMNDAAVRKCPGCGNVAEAK